MVSGDLWSVNTTPGCWTSLPFFDFCKTAVKPAALRHCPARGREVNSRSTAGPFFHRALCPGPSRRRSAKLSKVPGSHARATASVTCACTEPVTPWRLFAFLGGDFTQVLPSSCSTVFAPCGVPATEDQSIHRRVPPRPRLRWFEHRTGAGLGDRARRRALRRSSRSKGEEHCRLAEAVAVCRGVRPCILLNTFSFSRTGNAFFRMKAGCFICAGGMIESRWNN